MDTITTLRIALMDDDFYALKGNSSLLMRDIRTTVCAECLSPTQLFAWLRKAKKLPDIVLIDPEYSPLEIPLGELIQKIKTIAPQASIVCISQYGLPETVNAALSCGVKGFLLKDDVRLALVTAVTSAHKGWFTYSTGVEDVIQDEFADFAMKGKRLNRWELHPELTPRLEQVLWLCIIYGMSARMAAAELDLQPETIERYRTIIYDILSDGWYDESFLDDLNGSLTRESPQEDDVRGEAFWGLDWAFHIMTQFSCPNSQEWFNGIRYKKDRRYAGQIWFS